jgi:hypothetical protein
MIRLSLAGKARSDEADQGAVPYSRRMRRPHRWLQLIPIAVLSGCSSASPPRVSISPGSVVLEVSVSAGCPVSDVGYTDVANTFPGPPLAPPNPIGGLICRYGPGPHLGLNGAGKGNLASSTHLRQEQAVKLVDAVRQIQLTEPSGLSGCPDDVGQVTVIGLAYADRVDVGLWYKSGGCQTLDNGRIRTAEVGNPSFYQGFASVIDQLSPVPVSQGLTP